MSKCCSAMAAREPGGNGIRKQDGLSSRSGVSRDMHVSRSPPGALLVADLADDLRKGLGERLQKIQKFEGFKMQAMLFELQKSECLGSIPTSIRRS